MDTMTGEIKQFKTKEEFEANKLAREAAGQKPLVPLDDLPKPNCKKCHGRGYVGTNVLTKEKVVCLCTKRGNKATKIRGTTITAKTGWTEPKAPVGSPAAAL
jgi:hypothetical protein